VDAIVLVPMAPFKLSSRPWVIQGDRIVEVRFKLQEKEALVVVAGRNPVPYLPRIGWLSARPRSRPGL